MTVSDDDYAFLKALMQERLGHRLDDGKGYLINSRLGPLVQERGHRDVGGLLQEVRNGDAHLRSAVVEAMTINETSFFRDYQVFAALRDVVLPELVRTRSGRLSFWSAAAASGQEAYSLAMMMEDAFPRVPTPTILATDVSNAALDQARAGRYTQLEVNRGLPVQALTRHFTQVDRDWYIRPDLRNRVEFRQLNLAGPWPALRPMDLILLRNVLLYLHDDTRSRVLHHAARALRPGGYLVLGSAENMMADLPELESVVVGRTVLRRAPGAIEGAADAG